MPPVNHTFTTPELLAKVAPLLRDRAASCSGPSSRYWAPGTWSKGSRWMAGTLSVSAVC